MRAEFVRFLLVGGAAAAIQFGLLTIFLKTLQFKYWIAAAVAYFVSVLFHFLANRYFTFRKIGTPRAQEAGRYMTIVGLNFVVTMGLTILFVSGFSFSPYVATVFSIAATVCITFFSSRHWIFR